LKVDDFSDCLNFDVAKLSQQIQMLLLKLIQIGIFETPVLS
jgi:hypothetical protein